MLVCFFLLFFVDFLNRIFQKTRDSSWSCMERTVRTLPEFVERPELRIAPRTWNLRRFATTGRVLGAVRQACCLTPRRPARAGCSLHHVFRT
jgi:hypothetical protein